MINEDRLAIILSLIREHPNPNYFLQQYMISPGIAAKVLSYARVDIIGKKVFDLGCGTGRFAIGAALVGAKLAIGFDLDENVLEIAKENVKVVESKVGINISHIVSFRKMNVFDLTESCDTVLQFPPLDYDVKFVKKALEISNVVYSLHVNSIKRLEEIRNSFDKVKLIETFDYPLINIEDGKINKGVIFLRIWK